MFKRKMNLNQLDTVIGSGTYFEGNIKATGMVRVDGKLEGEIETQGDIVIGESGEVTAGLSGRNTTLAGKVYGDVHVKERFHILPTGILKGDVISKTLVVEEGAKLFGKCEMLEDEVKGKQASDKKAVNS